MKITLLIVFILLSSCTKRMEFEKEKWNKKIDITYTNRDAMLHDLTTNHQLKGLSFSELKKLLGKPENFAQADSNEVYYTIVENYGTDIDPVYVKYLVFKLTQDSTVANFKIEEHDM